MVESECMEILNDFPVLGGFGANVLGTKPGTYCFNSLGLVRLDSIL